jgi:hypothetical protein
MDRFGLNKNEAITLRYLIKGNMDPDEFVDVKNWVAQCYHEPPWIEKVMCAANQVLEHHGIELMSGRHSEHKFWFDTKYVYTNSGDAYSVSLFYDTEHERFFMSDWATMIEHTARDYLCTKKQMYLRK